MQSPIFSEFDPSPLLPGRLVTVYAAPASTGGFRGADLRINATQALFAWACFPQSPSLSVVQAALASVPDALLLDRLRRSRGKGRDDYPVSLLWGAALLTPLLRHSSHEACLGELRRNPSLRALLGPDVPEAQVPNKWNVSRFLENLGRTPHRGAVHDAFLNMVRRLALAVPDLGSQLAGDSTALHARRSRTEKKADAGPHEEEGLARPAQGQKDYFDDSGGVVRTFTWFGYKLHLLVDVRHEVAIAYTLTGANASDGGQIGPLLEQAAQVLPAGRMKVMAYDKAADDVKVHQLLNRHQVRPVIQTRALWKTEKERTLKEFGGRSHLVYDESGTVFCYDMMGSVPQKHQMAFVGHEKDRKTLKYRCPARHEGWACPSDERCNQGGKYGLVARIKQELDLRRFPSIPRGTKQFERLYKTRTAVERVNARLKIFWGADDGNVAGAERFHAQVGTVMLAHLAWATVLAMSERWEGKTLATSNVNSIANLLRAQIRAESAPRE